MGATSLGLGRIEASSRCWLPFSSPLSFGGVVGGGATLRGCVEASRLVRRPLAPKDGVWNIARWVVWLGRHIC